jgi:putative phage-type endonuclease
MTAFDRSTALGASDAAAALGLDPYRSPTDVWMEKTNQGTEVAGSIAMRLGNLLEDPVAQLYAEQTGRQVRRHKRACSPCTAARTEYACSDSAVFDMEHPFLFAHLDRVTRDAKGDPYEVLEIKTSGWPGEEWGPSGTDQVPLRVAVQVALQMRLAQMEVGNVAALLWGRELRTYRLTRDLDLERSLVAELVHFWHLVKTGEPPVHPDHPLTGKALRRLYPAEDEQPLPSVGTADWPLVESVVAAYAAWKESEALYKSKQTLMQARLGTLPGMEWDGGKITWKAVSSKKVDWQRVAEWVGTLAVEKDVMQRDEWDQFVADSTEEQTNRRFLVSIKRGGNGK